MASVGCHYFIAYQFHIKPLSLYRTFVFIDIIYTEDLVFWHSLMESIGSGLPTQMFTIHGEYISGTHYRAPKSHEVSVGNILMCIFASFIYKYAHSPQYFSTN